jgi:ribulose-5-phosphate 4-epimerase/fuculose-1-phosphate aldolase
MAAHRHVVHAETFCEIAALLHIRNEHVGVAEIVGERTLCPERFIHAAIFEVRPDITAVVHAHAEDTLAFGVANATRLRPVIHSGSFIGTVPVWD